MPNYWLPAILLCLVGTPLLAQTQPSSAPAPADSAPTTTASKTFRLERYEWDVNVDASFFLPRGTGNNWFAAPLYYNNYGPYYGSYYYNSALYNAIYTNAGRIMVRHNQPGNSAMRYTLALGAATSGLQKDSVRLYSSSQPAVESSANTLYAQGLVGREWQQQLGRFQLFYGADAGLQYARDKREGSLYNRVPNGNGGFIDQTAPYEFLNRQLALQVAPLAGARFFLHSRFSLALESKFVLAYSWSRLVDDLSTGSALQSGRGNGFSANLVPISSFNAAFHFGSVTR